MTSKIGTLAVYPGSFDPVTKGHLDIARRARETFGSLIITISRNSSKNALFTLEERAKLLKEALQEEKIEGVEVAIFDGLLVDYVKSRGARVIVRGLRFISDFEYEFQMALTNRHLLTEVETVFMMPDEKFIYLSSSIIKEIALCGRSPAQFVPKCVAQALQKKFK